MTFGELLVTSNIHVGSSSPPPYSFIFRVAALREGQSQALNSNLLRDKLKLQC